MDRQQWIDLALMATAYLIIRLAIAISYREKGEKRK